MVATEVDSFVKKFYQLWNAGLNAHLDLDTHAGSAWVGLRVQLGHAPGDFHQHLRHPFPHNRKQENPSRQRRRARRAAARETEAAEQAINKETDENAEKADEEIAVEVVGAAIKDIYLL